MEQPKYDYDLLVIGSGPAGHHAALEAAKMGKHVAVVDRNFDLGGVCLHTGTIPSKTLREAALYLSGFRQRSFYGRGYRVKAKIQIQDLMFRVSEVVKRQYQVIQDQLMRHQVEVVDGHAVFTSDPHELEVMGVDRTRRYSAQYVLIACGTRPSHIPGVPFEAPQVYDSDEFIQVTEGEFPKTLIVVGGGVIGLEYASMAAALGSDVTVVESRDTLLQHVDCEITAALMYHLRRNGVTFRMGETVTTITADSCGTATAHLESGKTLVAEALLYAIGRQPNTDKLNLEAIQLPVVDRGKLAVNDFFQTAISHIYAAGDVVGFPSLASTSMEQGRLAAHHMFGVAREHRPELLPFGIYTIPEISMVGQTEQQLTGSKIPYEVGVAAFDDVARAQIAGDQVGMLKLIFHADTLKLLGVHILGEGASELVHIGQMAMVAGNTLDMISETVFNYPSLGEAYRVAAANGLDRVRRRAVPLRGTTGQAAAPGS